MNPKKWKRNCPKCDKIIFYTKYVNYNNAIKKKTSCLFCRYQVRQKHTSETILKLKNRNYSYMMGENNWSKRKDVKEKISKKNMGTKNGMFGKTHSDQIKNKSIETCLKRYGYTSATKSDAVRKKMRLSHLKRISKQYFDGGQVFPSYNPEACRLLDRYSERNNLKLRHALNGGELCVGGFFPDGIDVNKNVIVEVDEKHHFCKNGNLRNRDIDRQRFFENLGYKVIRIRI